MTFYALWIPGAITVPKWSLITYKEKTTLVVRDVGRDRDRDQDGANTMM